MLSESVDSLYPPSRISIPLGPPFSVVGDDQFRPDVVGDALRKARVHPMGESVRHGKRREKLADPEIHRLTTLY